MSLKRPEDVQVGDCLVMTKSTTWRVLSKRPYEGPLECLRGGFIVVSDRGAITLEPGVPVEVLS